MMAADFYSFAASGSGTSDPDAINYFTVEDGNCPLDHCAESKCEHNVLMWTGEEYSRNHTWMTCDKKHTIDLEEHR